MAELRMTPARVALLRADADRELDAMMQGIIAAHESAYHRGRPCRENESGQCKDRADAERVATTKP